MKRLILASSLLLLVGAAHAQDQPDPTGTWVWTMNFGGNSMERVLTLAVEDTVLTGTINGPNGDADISNGVYRDGKVSFDVVRSFNGNEFTISYVATIEGDALRGESRANFNGEERTFEWEASRRK